MLWAGRVRTAYRSVAPRLGILTALQSIKAAMAADWKEQTERSNAFWVRLLLRIGQLGGRPLARLILWPVVAYFLCSSPKARAASRQYLRLALGREPVWADLWRHFHCFAATVLDRLFLADPHPRQFEVDIQGDELFDPLVQRGQGGLIFVAHIGSFDALRLASLKRSDGLRLRVLLNMAHGAAFNSVLRALNPALLEDIIDTSRGGVDLALQVGEALQRGEMVAMMADRLEDPAEPTLELRLLGAPVCLPARPWLLALSLGVPVFGCVCLYLGGKQYRLRFEALLPGGQTVPRPQRLEQAADLAQRWLEGLEEALSQAPYNWFNFYPYFEASSSRAD